MTYNNCVQQSVSDGRCSARGSTTSCQKINLESRRIKYLASYSKEEPNQCGGFDFITARNNTLGLMDSEKIAQQDLIETMYEIPEYSKFMGFYVNDSGRNTPTWYAAFAVPARPEIPIVE